jgi:insertion element IS1 protein InsB
MSPPNFLRGIYLQWLQARSQKIGLAMVGGRFRHSGDLALSRHQHHHGDFGIKKKEGSLSYVNKEYFQSHSHIKIRVEMDEMWSFYGDKEHQLWLWWAMDHDTGEVIAFWFGTREHCNLDKLLALLSPLSLGKVYTDGNYAYFERFSSEVLVVSKRNTQKLERKHLSLRTWCSRLVRKGIFVFPKRNKCTKSSSDSQ